MKNNFEPFRIKSVELLKITTKEERNNLIQEAGYNVVLLKSEDVLIDLLTDSGTTAMSTEQWAALHRGDESYVRSPSFYKFQDAVKSVMPFKHIIPTHQGRSAERILANISCDDKSIVPSNSHFDTTRANFESMKSTAIDLVINTENGSEDNYLFKGNMDLKRLSEVLENSYSSIPLVMLTITNNTVGGQPVSMENICKTSELCKKYNIPLFFDACRYAENAYFIKKSEPGYESKSIKHIINKMFSYADGVIMSAKKDALVNTGGWLALNDDLWAEKAMDLLLLTEGFITYGGLSGRDLDAIAVGIYEGINENYLRYRIQSVEYLGNALSEIGIPVIKPFGGHAVYIDAKEMFPNIHDEFNPGQVLNVELYIEGGIRACEISSVKLDVITKKQNKSESILVRLAIPRRVYTQSHLDHIVDVFDKINNKKSNLSGLRMTDKPHALRHYAAKYEPVYVDSHQTADV